MRAVLLAPHNDDEVLFATYLALRHRADVVVCVWDGDGRVEESRRAVQDVLGLRFSQWRHAAKSTLPERLRSAIGALRHDYDIAIAPLPNFEQNGHSPEGPLPDGFGILHHDIIGQVALDTWGADNTILYRTYTRWGGRDCGGVEVLPEPGWVALKLRALACYTSQHDNPATAYWFIDSTLREYV